MSKTDTDLVLSWLTGNRQAGGELYTRYSRTVRAYLLRSGFTLQTSDDLVHEIFFRVYRSLHTFDPDRGRFITWLWAVARNTVRKHWKKIPAEENYDAHLAEAVFEDHCIDDPSVLEELDALRQCMSKLQSEYRQYVDIGYYQSLTTRGTAAATGIPESTIRLRLEEARGMLLKCMRSDGSGKN